MEGDLPVAVGGDLCEVSGPGLARVDAKLLGRFAGEQVPGAFDVIGGEPLAVVPFDPLTQREGQLGAVLAPRPAGRELGNDRIRAVLLYMLIEQDEVVEYPHDRPLGDDRRFLVDRYAGGAVDHVFPEDAALLLGDCRRSGNERSYDRHGDRYVSPKLASHQRSPFLPAVGFVGLHPPCSLTTASPRYYRISWVERRETHRSLFVEPGVLEAPAIVIAVDHHRVAFEIGLPAGRRHRVEDGRSGRVLGELALDFPDDLLALVRVGLARLPVDQPVDLSTAVAGVVALGAAGEILVELLIGIVEPVLADRHTDRIILAHDGRIPLRRVDRVEGRVDIDLLQLVDQQYRRVAIGRGVARGHGRRERLVRPIAQPLHDDARLLAVFGGIGAVSRQRLQDLRRHTPAPGRRRHHRPANGTLPVAENVDKGAAIE